MSEISFEKRKKEDGGLGIPEQDDESFSIQRLEQKLPSIFYHNSQQKMNEE